MNDAAIENPELRNLESPSILWKLAQTFCRIMTTVLWDLKVYGGENVPLHGGVLLVSNHQSYLDPVILGVQIRRPLSYLAKSELFKNYLFGKLLRWLHAFPIKQGAGDVSAVKQTIARLQEGHALNIFPEGSRTEDGRILPMEKGVALVVRRARVPVIPVAIDGSFQAWPKYRTLPRPGRIRVLYGSPMELSELKSEEIIRRIDAALHNMFNHLHQLDEAENSSTGDLRSWRFATARALNQKSRSTDRER